MKKTFKNVALLAAALVLPLSFTSCSSDDDNSSNETPVVNASELAAVANTYVNDVIDPTYTDLAANAKILNEKCEALYAKAQSSTLTDQDVVDACEAFKNARREWERSEAFLYGAATDNEIDPHIDDWPAQLDKIKEGLTNETLMNGIKNGQGAEFVYEKNGDFSSVLGFHGLEFILFRNGAARPASAYSAVDTEVGPNVQGIDELALASAISGDLRNMTALLQYGWTGDSSLKTWLTNNCKWVLDGTKYNGLSKANISYGQFLLNATQSNGYFSTWQETMENIFVGGCSDICQEVYTQKLGQAYRVAHHQGGVDEDGNPESLGYIESPYSQRSFYDYQDNIYSIKNSLYGTRDVNATTPVANSLMTIMKNYNYERYNNLSTALNDAIEALSVAQQGEPFKVNPGREQVKVCIDKINVLDDELNLAGKWFRALKTK